MNSRIIYAALLLILLFLFYLFILLHFPGDRGSLPLPPLDSYDPTMQHAILTRYIRLSYHIILYHTIAYRIT